MVYADGCNVMTLGGFMSDLCGSFENSHSLSHLNFDF